MPPISFRRIRGSQMLRAKTTIRIGIQKGMEWNQRRNHVRENKRTITKNLKYLVSGRN